MQVRTLVFSVGILILNACASVQYRQTAGLPTVTSTQVAPVPAFQAKINPKGSNFDSDAVIMQANAAGEAVDARGDGVFTVTATNGTRPNMEIFVSKDRDAVDGWEVRPLTATMEIAGGYRIRIKSIPGERIHHDRIIRFKVRNGTDSATYHLRNLDNFRIWGGLGSPVLYRVQGNASKFGLDDFAPSLAGGPRFIFGSGAHQFIGINPLVTVFRVAEDEADQERPFSLSLGGIVDFGGWGQIGANYQFKDGKTHLIIGVRPEVWTK